MPFTEIKPVAPVVEEAVSEKIYNKMWVKQLNIQAGNPNAPVRLVAVFAPSRDVTVDGTTTKELKKDGEIRIVVEDLFAEAASNAAIAQAMEAVFIALKAKGVEQGKFSE